MTASFWGLVVEPNKLYSQTVPAGFKLSMASLGPQEETKTASSDNTDASDKKRAKTSASTTLMVRLDEKDDYALCSLTPGHLNQQALDLIFTEGESIALRVVGDQPLHLTGYYLPDESHDDYDMDSDEEEYDSEDDEELDSDDFDDDSEEEDEDEESDGDDRIKEITSEEETSIKKRHDHGTTEEEEMTSDASEDMSDVSSSEEEEELPPKTTNKRAAQAKEEEAKKAKVESKKDSPKPTQEPAKKSEPSKKDSPKAAKKTEPRTDGKQQPEKKTLPNGLIIEDVKIGEGIKAQQGRRVGIAYKGTLLSNGKTFDTNKGKPLFYFTPGKGEVIKGMDQGVQGMALGGERRITIPSALGYGPKGAPPAIPGDATLVFEIKLEKVASSNGK